MQRKKNTGFGDAELTRLWGLHASGAEPKVIAPPFSEFVERVLEEANPDNDIEEQYQVRQKAVFQWKMMRAGLDQLVMLQHGTLFKVRERKKKRFFFFEFFLLFFFEFFL